MRKERPTTHKKDPIALNQSQPKERKGEDSLDRKTKIPKVCIESTQIQLGVVCGEASWTSIWSTKTCW